MSTILIKKNDTSGHIPASGDLTNDSGGAEIAVNTADGKLYTKNSAGEIIELINKDEKSTFFHGKPANGWCLLGWITASQRCVAGVRGGDDGTPTAGANSTVSCDAGAFSGVEGTQ